MPLIFLFFLHSFIQTSLAEKWSVTASGCVKCNGEELRYVKIKLMDEDVFFDDEMAYTRAGRDGCFKLTGKGKDAFGGKPEPYIKVEYSYDGEYGRMDVEKFFGVNRYGRTQTQNYSKTIEFGLINFDNVHCMAYLRYFDAIEDYNRRTGMALPYKTLHVKTEEIIHGGTPYTTTDVVRIPKSYPKFDVNDLQTARHELAHSIRHTFDGSIAHFLADAMQFWYMRNHYCHTKSNHGYAFNEGWAEFWSYDCTPKNWPGDANDYTIEGNVAEALRNLQNFCKATDAKMVEVLRKNPRKIHSFDDFHAKFNASYGCYI